MHADSRRCGERQPYLTFRYFTSDTRIEKGAVSRAVPRERHLFEVAPHTRVCAVQQVAGRPAGARAPALGDGDASADCQAPKPDYTGRFFVPRLPHSRACQRRTIVACGCENAIEQPVPRAATHACARRLLWSPGSLGYRPLLLWSKGTGADRQYLQSCFLEGGSSIAFPFAALRRRRVKTRETEASTLPRADDADPRLFAGAQVFFCIQSRQTAASTSNEAGGDPVLGTARLAPEECSEKCSESADSHLRFAPVSLVSRFWLQRARDCRTLDMRCVVLCRALCRKV